jgi:hypothetical protein
LAEIRSYNSTSSRVPRNSIFKSSGRRLTSDIETTSALAASIRHVPFLLSASSRCGLMKRKPAPNPGTAFRANNRQNGAETSGHSALQPTGETPSGGKHLHRQLDRVPEPCDLSQRGPTPRKRHRPSVQLCGVACSIRPRFAELLGHGDLGNVHMLD